MSRASKSTWQIAAEADEPTLSEQDGVRYLHFGSEWVQGAMRLARPSELVLAYTGQMMAWMLFLKAGSRDRLGILGLGAGSLLRFALRHTRASIETVERNVAVVAVCRSYFRLSESARSRIDLGDARDWVADPARVGRYRVLLVDLYDAQAQGPVCGDVDFYRDCWRALDETGIMAVNLFGHHSSFGSNLQNIRAAFRDQVVCLPEVDEGNTVALAFKGAFVPPDLHDWLSGAQALEARTGLPAQRWAHALLASPGLWQRWQGGAGDPDDA
ncbi:MAG: spermidine synthase [Castellaniella sp.]|uniref:spermidine synthase n=1 Tax=Castellaniella sp. TaxID=1955812 RepID=UPI0011FD6344|nr:spermidine synthase [Castellaniella sp.]TAN29274.1 MAG: spermidine synthase [Castellaniella sp.]